MCKVGVAHASQSGTISIVVTPVRAQEGYLPHQQYPCVCATS
jgi:hypothetical protein